MIAEPWGETPPVDWAAPFKSGPVQLELPLEYAIDNTKFPSDQFPVTLRPGEVFTFNYLGVEVAITKDVMGHSKAKFTMGTISGDPTDSVIGDHVLSPFFRWTFKSSVKKLCESLTEFHTFRPINPTDEPRVRLLKEGEYHAP